MMENRTTIQISDKLRKELRVLAGARDISYQDLLEDMISVFKELDKGKTIISIPTKLADKLKTNIKNTDFRNLSDYVCFLARIFLYEDEIVSKQKDIELVKSRLKSLGYL